MIDGVTPAEGRIDATANLRALAHPIRWALIEVLSVEGTATAMRCAQIIGESHGTCSFHLRQLARFGIVEEAPTDSRRERPWRMRSVHQSWSNAPTDDPARDLAARELSQVFVDREAERIRRWARDEAGAPAEWRRASFRSGVLTWLTPAELDELGDQLAAVMQTYVDRIEDPSRRPEGSRPVRLFSTGFPVLEFDPTVATPSSTSPKSSAKAGDDVGPA